MQKKEDRNCDVIMRAQSQLVHVERPLTLQALYATTRNAITMYIGNFAASVFVIQINTEMVYLTLQGVSENEHTDAKCRLLGTIAKDISAVVCQVKCIIHVNHLKKCYNNELELEDIRKRGRPKKISDQAHNFRDQSPD